MGDLHPCPAAMFGTIPKAVWPLSRGGLRLPQGKHAFTTLAVTAFTPKDIQLHTREEDAAC